MTQLNRLAPANKGILALICTTSLFMGACSENNVKPEKLSDTQACNNLKDLIADHANQFKNTRTDFSSHKRLSIWSAKKVFPSADNCQVWEWSTGLFNYVCEWSSGKDENQALNHFQDGNNIIQSCLGNTWSAQTSETQSGGKRLTYSAPDKNTIVSIRYFKEQKGWMPAWQNTVVIGDKNNLNAPLQ